MAVAFAAMIMGLSRPAHAGLEIILSGGGMTATVTDIGAPNNFNGTGGAPNTTVTSSPGTVDYLPTGGFAGITIVSLTVTSNYPGGTGSQGSFVQDIQLDVTNTSSAAVTLTLTVISDGFTVPAPNAPATLLSTLTNNSVSGSTSTFQSYIGTVNTPIVNALSVPTFTSTGTTGPQGPLSGVSTNTASTGVTVPGTPSFTLSNTLTGVIAAGGSDLIDGLTTLTSVVPEPSSIVMGVIGMALPLVGGAFRWRRRRA